MNRFCQGRRWLVTLFTVTVVLSSAAQSFTNFPASGRASLIPSAIIPRQPSPVLYFRKLLAMSPEQRESALAKKPPAIRERILAKVNEYAELNPEERELRLCATDLRWYLTPLLQSPPDQRTALLASVPDDIHDIVQARLEEWEILPPQLQQEFLDNEHILGYFTGVGGTNNVTAGAKPSDAEQSHWNALPDNQRQAMISEFNQFFELSTREKQKALGELSDTERKQMQKTLQTFANLSPMERRDCIRAFGRFAGMSPAERAEFLRNSQRWSKMTPSERKAWRDLVAHVPAWPPMPPPAIIMPPMPSLPQNAHALAGTNHG
jgi:predicted Fe-S protein YdhL (DUF1289 family)